MKELTQLLEGLAEKLGTTTKYLWEVLIKQARIDFISTTIQYLLLAIAVFVWINLFRYCLKNHKKIYEDDKEMVWGISLGITSVILFILTMIAFFYINTYLASILNPEYWALQQILYTVKR